MLVVVCLLLISSYGSLPATVAASTEYCVTVTEESACPCNVTCHSLDHYLASPGDYFKSGVMFRFLPGEHHVHETFSGSGIEGLSFVKDEIGGSNVTVLLTMSNYSSPWFSLRNSSSVYFSGIDFKFYLNRSDSECNGFVFDLLYVNDVSLTDVVMNSCGGGLLLNGGHNVLISHMTNYYSNHSGVHLINTTGSIGIENASFSGPSTALYIFYDNTNMSCFLTNELRIRFSTFSDVASGLLVYLQGTSGCLNISVLQSTFRKLEEFGFQVLVDSPELSLDVQVNSTTSEEGNGTAMIFDFNGYKNMHLSIHDCSFKRFGQGGVVLYQMINL